MKETGDMTKAVGAIIREQMSRLATMWRPQPTERTSQREPPEQDGGTGAQVRPTSKEASNNLWTSMKIGILDIIGGPLTSEQVDRGRPSGQSVWRTGR